MRKKLGLKEKDIILYGESLGTGVATEIAQSNNYAGLVLETPFTSMVEAAKNFYPYIPVSLLLKDKYDNQNKIKNIIDQLHFRIDLSESFTDWNFLSKFHFLDFNTITISDRYILTDKDNQKIRVSLIMRNV